MVNQNILKYYGSKLDIKLDTSQLYDFQLGETYNDYDSRLLYVSSNDSISYESEVIDSDCLNSISTPIIFDVNTNQDPDSCDFLIRRRTERGWTLDFIFNRNNNPWSVNNTFYYLGIFEETESDNYLDNNLSFQFTENATIKWLSYRYSGHCQNNGGYVTNNYISSGETNNVLSGITTQDFNISITFERYNTYYDCDLLNEGGQNDLITGWTVDNIYDVLTGATEEFTLLEELNLKWDNGRKKRLGTLRIFLNGKIIYKIKNWEEIIPSERNSDNRIVQIWGGGTEFSGNIHNGECTFDLLKFKYYEEPLQFNYIKHNYLTNVLPYFSTTENEICDSDLIAFTTNGLLTENDENLITENGDLILF
jgi:hypothetical protein